MKIRIVQGVVAAAVLSFGALAYGQASNAIPSEETFEGMSVGGSILVPNNINGWYGDTNTTVAIATNLSYAWTNVYPIASAAHTQVLKFSSDGLTNQFEDYNAVSAATATNMTVDFMIQSVQSADAPSSNLVAGSQTAFYVDTNGSVHVWCGLDDSGANNAWVTFTNTPIGTSDWARVTVAFDYTGDLADGGVGDSFFKITLNGIPLTPSTGYTLSGFGYAITAGGKFLHTASLTKQVRSFALSSSGMLDDFVITTNAVTNFFPAPAGSYTLTGSAGANGTVTPASTNVASGGSADFVVTAASYYRIASLTTNGGSVGTFDNSSTATNFTWSNVLANGTLAATFTAQLANNASQTPYWWMVQYGLTNAGATFDQAAVADQDHDGMQAWQEYIVGTDPTNAASVLKVLSVTSDGVSETVKWLDAAGAPNYNLRYSLNLTNAGNGWVDSSNNIVRNPPTNSVTITPPSQPVFYKITVTN